MSERWTAHDYITRAFERTANVDSMIARLHEYGYEIRPIEPGAAVSAGADPEPEHGGGSDLSGETRSGGSPDGKQAGAAASRVEQVLQFVEKMRAPDVVRPDEERALRHLLSLHAAEARAQGGPSLDVERLRHLIAEQLWDAATSAYFGGSPSWGPKDYQQALAKEGEALAELQSADRIIADARLSVGEPRP